MVKEHLIEGTSAPRDTLTVKCGIIILLSADHPDSMTIDDCLKTTTSKLGNCTECPRLEAEILLSFTLKKQRAYLYTWPEETLKKLQVELLDECINKRLSGVPSAYITGVQEFWSMPFKVTPDVLIPRAETELLVETVLNLLPDIPQNIVDLGTGSGAIAIALSLERPQWNVCAVDQSSAALIIARENAHNLGASCISFMPGDWYEPLGNSRFHAIISNPPYIETSDTHLESLAHEPLAALTSGADGLDDIKIIVTGAQHHLHKGGYLVMEHGYHQRQDLLAIFSQHSIKPRSTLDDLSGIPRVIIGQL